MLRKFSITALPQALEIARCVHGSHYKTGSHHSANKYCQSLFVIAFTGVKGWLAFYCTNVVLNVHIEAHFDFNASHRGAALLRDGAHMIWHNFGGNVKVGTDFRFIFLRRRPAELKISTTTTDHDQSGRVQVCPLNTF
ncbi:hypothetical protein KCP74_04725 [Salmonella enterica subsp. enterica]|nr:hypothetical protein KCP74_04725 [Salmonella enterica subsp. enterica]